MREFTTGSYVDFSDVDEADACVLQHRVIAATIPVGDKHLEVNYPEFDTNTRFFAAAFDSIHPGMIEQLTPPDYFIGIIRTAVQVAMNEQHHGMQNHDQLWNDSVITAEFIRNMWDNSNTNRLNNEPFSVYEFGLGDNIYRLMCTPDIDTNTWKIGYGVEIPQTIQRIGRYSYDVTDGILNADPIGT